MTEEWRTVDGSQGYVEVSDLGSMRVKPRPRHNSNRLIPGRTLKPWVTNYGYHQVAVEVLGEQVRGYVHRFVAKAFVDGYFEGAHVDHLDGDKLNNRASNLEWVSVEENTRRQWASGLNPGQYRGTNVTAKLTDLQVHAIQMLYQGNFPPQLLAEWFGVSESLIYKLTLGAPHAAPLKSRHDPRLAA